MKDLRAVTFDCWSTLIREAGGSSEGYRRRIAALTDAASLASEEAEELISKAWEIHNQHWVNGISYGAPEIAAWIADQLGEGDEIATTLVQEFEDAALHGDVVPLEGAAETLAAVKAAGLKTALVCDTGFSPGRVVRQLLDRVGLLSGLDALVFSNEVGVPKPNPKMFETALKSLEVDPSAAVHVGDLKRTDVAGAKAFGMRTIRIAADHDDPADLDDADHVVRHHNEIPQVLGL